MKKEIGLVLFLGIVIASGTWSHAGDLVAPADPETWAGHSLEDVYNRLNTGEGGVQRTFTEPAAGPVAGSGHTLNEIMAVAPILMIISQDRIEEL